MPDFIGVHHVNFSVTDLDRSAAWYIRVLGLQRGWVMDDIDGRGRKIVLLHHGSPLRIVLSLHAANSGETADEHRTGLDHVAFGVRDRPALGEWLHHLEELGVVHSEIKEGATGWLITLRDPDNIQLEVYTLGKE
jgi:glyoxylase I family protein